jgi:Flp pilus assembly protein TadD
VSNPLLQMQTRLNRLFGEGTSALAAADYSLAANTFARALEIDPDLAEAHVNLGFALLGLQQVNAAKSEFNLAREINPEQANLYYGLAMVHEHEQEFRQAVLAMQTFLHLAEEAHPFVRKATAAIWEWNEQLRGSEGGS